MLYTEYLNAARKHLDTCETLKTAISNLNLDFPQNKTKHKRLCLNLYYLTGYILECSIKFGIYKLVGHDPKKSVSKLNVVGIDYQDDIKNHRFSRYAEHLVVRQPGIKLVDNINYIPEDVVYLYSSWDVSIRYMYKEINPSINSKLSQENLFCLLSCADEVLKTVQRL